MSSHLRSSLLDESDNINGHDEATSSDHVDDKERSSSLLPTVDRYTYGPFVCYCFTVNYILGVGVLGMPNAFQSAGWLLSAVTVLAVTLMAALTGMWLVSAGQRAKAYLWRQYRRGAADRSSVFGENGSERTIEINELVEIFAGVGARRGYEFSLIVLIVGALWAYVSVFAASMSSHIGIPGISDACQSTDSTACYHLYLFWIAVFAVIVIPLTCMELAELTVIMVALALFRFVSLGTMMVTSIASMYSFPATAIQAKDPTFVPRSSAPYYGDAPIFNMVGFSSIFPTAIYSQIFHHSIPGLQKPLPQESKRHAPTIFLAVLATTFALYSMLGLTVSLYYGSATFGVCTINWASYTGLPDGEGGPSHFAEFISYLVVLFPPIDILSAFPLNAITLANNIMSASLPHHLHTQRCYVLPFRILAAVLPIIGACIVSDLSVILNFTGSVGVLIAFGFPVMIQWSKLQPGHPTNNITDGGLIIQPAVSSDQVDHSIDRSVQSDVVADDDDDANHEEIIMLPRWHSIIESKAAVYVVATFAILGLILVIVFAIISFVTSLSEDSNNSHHNTTQSVTFESSFHGL